MNEKNRFNETETEMNEGAMPEETVSETEETGGSDNRDIHSAGCGNSRSCC